MHAREQMMPSNLLAASTAYGAIHRAGYEALDAFILAEIGRAGQVGASTPDIRAALSLNNATVFRHLRYLEEAGLVVSAVGVPQRRRAPHLWTMTAEGRSLLLTLEQAASTPRAAPGTPGERPQGRLGASCCGQRRSVEGVGSRSLAA